MLSISYKKTILVPGIILLSIIGLITFQRNRPVPSNIVFEILFFTGSISLFKYINKYLLIFVGITLLYLAYSLFSAIYLTNTNLFDFIQAYKSFMYIPFLALASGKKVFKANFIKNLFRFLLFCFLIKYIISFIGRFDKRPILFYENNYELIFLLLLFYLNYLFQKKLNFLEFITLFAVICISGSRSAILAFLIVFIFISMRNKKKVVFNSIIIIVILLTSAYVFINRLNNSSLENVDRYKFIMMFIHDTQEWPWWKFLTGAQRLTPMSDFVSKTLSYYQSLFSYKNNGTCYSVILHSFILRILFDHGIIGLLFLIAFIYKSLRISSFSILDSICFISIIAVTSLSVSALNNAFVMLGLLIVYASKNYNVKIMHKSYMYNNKYYNFTIQE